MQALAFFYVLTLFYSCYILLLVITCSVSKYHCFNNAGNLITVTDTDMSQCSSTRSILIDEWTCPDYPTQNLASISATVDIATPSAFATNFNNYVHLNLVFYVLLLFVAFYFVASSLFKR